LNVSRILALLVMGYGFILDRSLLSHLILTSWLKMNCQRLLFMETDVKRNFV